MKIAVIGTGYVGLVSGACFAELGHEVICVDRDSVKIDTLQEGTIPIFEPGLEALVRKNMHTGALRFTTDTTLAVRQSELIMLAVGTPSLPSGEADLQHIQNAAADIAEAMNGCKLIVVKSTVPVGTNSRISRLIGKRTGHRFHMASVPEFLREGTAVHDMFHPDRIVIGAEDDAVAERLAALHRPICSRIFTTDIRSAEMIKYASNAFLATKISFINEIANICEKVGADVEQVAAGMGLDRRIGPSYLEAGIGYGGSCFPKDTQALIQIAGNVNYRFKLLKAVVEVNHEQRLQVIRKLYESLDRIAGSVVCVWGLAFKPNTDDVRDAPAMDLIPKLLERGAYIRAYDPVAQSNFKKAFNHPNIEWCESAMEAASGSDAVCLLTEWPEFVEVDLQSLCAVIKQPVMIDGRNMFSREQIEGAPLRYYSFGRPAHNRQAEAPAIFAAG